MKVKTILEEGRLIKDNLNNILEIKRKMVMNINLTIFLIYYPRLIRIHDFIQ